MVATAPYPSLDSGHLSKNMAENNVVISKYRNIEKRKNMKQKEGFVLRTVCGEHVIVGEGLGTIDFGKLISLNETAAWIWKKAGEMGDFDIDSLAKALCDEYEVDAQQAHDDVTKMVKQWQELGIVED